MCSYNKRYKTYRAEFEQVFCSDAWVMSQGWDLMVPGCPGGGGVKNIFSNMVMWHIKLTGMIIRTECKLNFQSNVKLVTLGEVKRTDNVKV